MADDAKTFMIEDAKLVFKNFAGKEDQYNREGDRNFSAILPEDVALEMEKDGWNVKRLKDREDDEGNVDPGDYYIQVAVNFKHKPPRVVMISSTSRTPLSEDAVEVLDWASLSTVDFIARAYEWTVNGKSGIKAYLQSLYATIEEDELDRKYAEDLGPND